MTDALRTALEARGARFGPDDRGLPASFGDPVSEFAALAGACAWSIERPAIVAAPGSDVLDLLNRLGTNQVHDLAAGEARPTVLTSPKGRIVARLWCHHLGDPGILMLVDRGAAAEVIAHLDRYTFAEDTRLSDASDRFATIVVRGPRAAEAAAGLFDAAPAADATGTTDLEGCTVHVLGHDLLGGPGFTVIALAGDAAAVLDAVDRAVRDLGGSAAGSLAVEPWRIGNGLPRTGSELDGEHNPLEAGLRDAVHFSKGCYVGQEVVARLETYDKVSRRLMVVRPAGPATEAPAAGDLLNRDGRAIGTVTSVASVPGARGWVALAYVKRSRGEHGGAVEVAGRGPGVLLDPPVETLA